MESLTSIITAEIKRQYKSVRQFSIRIGIPQTTIASALKNGISGTSYETVVRICDALDIKLINYDEHIVINERTLDFLKKLNSLDEVGLHTVIAVLEAEFRRVDKNK